MNKNHNWKRVALAGIASIAAFASTLNAQDDLPSREEMWAIIQKQQEQINTLLERVEGTEGKLVETTQAIEVATEQVETTASFVEGYVLSGTSANGQTKGAGRTHLGGYGELHYNFGKVDKADFHRWVLLLDHAFNDQVRLVSEVELEHSIAGDGKTGEIELEQAYVEFDLNENDSAKAGLFLIPVGILNETHEPATFYGVERNSVEKNIIPSTWWEGGVAYRHTNEAGWAFDAAAHTGLFSPTSGSKAFNIRSGRQKVGNAEASNGALTTRVTYTGTPGLQVGVSAQYQTDIAQSTFSETIDATLLSAHADYQRGGFGLRALYARWDLGGAAPGLTGADEQFGYYIEPSYRFETEAGDLGFFARYSVYDNHAGSSSNTEDAYFDIGMNYWPIENVVFKWDIQFTDYANSSKDEEIINLGVGYQF